MKVAAPQPMRNNKGPSTGLRQRNLLLIAALPFAISLALVIGLLAYIHARTSAVPVAGSLSSISPLRQLMGLSDVPLRYAPGFTLLDQNGQSVSLNQFRGHSVVLAFMDSRCTTVCPVLTQEFLLAQKDLGSAAAKVDFVAVNVNPLAAQVSDVVAFDQLHGLTNMANWHFLTGPGPKLLQIAKQYGISVQVPANNDPNQIVHADYVYFLNPKGQERYLASPVVDQTKSGTGYLPQATLAQWGHGIASYAQKLLANG